MTIELNMLKRIRVALADGLTEIDEALTRSGSQEHEEYHNRPAWRGIKQAIKEIDMVLAESKL